MSDSSLCRKAGRGLVRALSRLLGARTVRKAKDSASVLAREYRAGKREAEKTAEAPAPRTIPHRTLRSVTGRSEPPPAS
jgi:hypothetical protein